jgi:tRNA A-37 threonylcarbamoyl transferase component Bud32
MAAILDTGSKIWQRDVAHIDLCPKNIILISTKEGESADIRVIDFGHTESGYRAERRESAYN